MEKSGKCVIISAPSGAGKTTILEACIIAATGRSHRAGALRELPERGRVVPELRSVDVFVYRELIAKPWRIIYRFERGRVFVLVVLDSRRDLTSILLERLAR